MAITNSLGAFQAPMKYDCNHRTPVMADFLQTSGSAVGTATVNIIAKESSADACHLLWLTVAQTDPTAAGVCTIYAGTATVLGQFATGAIGSMQFNFGPVGLVCGNTDTYSCYIKSTGTTTVYFAAGFYRLK